jgi:branched-chain amino acid transport system permease protein
MSWDQFINLFINGLATGMLIFLLAAGLTLIFGLMDVLNFAHGAFFAWGAYTGAWIYAETGSFVGGILGGILAGILIGFIMEKLTIQPVYGNPVSQILITMGVMLVLSELIKVFFGPNPLATPVPALLDGSWAIGNIIIIKYRVFIILMGLLTLIGLSLLLNKSKIGLMIRAGVSNKEMVQALGINIKQVFAMVFMLGAGLAALGGVLLGPYSGTIQPGIGFENQLLAFIVVVIGGLGSISGSALAGILVGLAGSFMAFYFPEGALAVNVLLMALVLLLKPKGLFNFRG